MGVLADVFYCIFEESSGLVNSTIFALIPHVTNLEKVYKIMQSVKNNSNSIVSLNSDHRINKKIMSSLGIHGN